MRILEAAGLSCHAPTRFRYIVVANNGMSAIAGELSVPFKVGGITKVVNVLYVPDLNTTLILGIDFWRRYHLRPDFLNNTCEVGEIGLVPIEERGEEAEEEKKEDEDSVLDSKQKEELEDILEEFRPLLDTGELGCLKGVVHHIDTGDEPPCKQKYTSLNPRKLAEAHRELDERLKLGIVEPSESPYSSPLLMIPKKDTGWRWVVDFRKLNEAIKRPNAHPLPKIDPMLWNVRGGTIFSSIDIKDAYLQIPLSDDSKAKTAFTVPGRGLFQYTRLPAGLKDAAGRWQSAIERVLGNDPHVMVYMDDILIWSPNLDWEHHKEMIRKVFKKLSDAGLTLKLSKCVFGRKRTLYLGHVIDSYGIRPDPSKVAAVANFPRPTTVKQVRQFMGLAGWMRKFVKSFSIIARPLYDLYKGDTKFKWGEKEEGAFIQLKERLCSQPVLRSPDFNLPFKVYTDGSALGTGAILVQDFPGEGEHVVAYTSRGLKGRESKYSATELECLAVLHAVEAFRPYLEGYHWELITDHASLQWLHKLKNPSGRLARWAVSLQQYDFSITHRKGRCMEAPDALSRNPVEDVCSEACVDPPTAVSVCLVDLPEEIEDEWYHNLMKRVEDAPDDYPKFSIVEGRLFKQITVSSHLPLRWVQVIPKEGRAAILQMCHDDPVSGHGGVYRTFHRVRIQAYWPEMQKEIIAYIKNCEVCQRYKVERRRPAGLMGSQDTISQPFEVLSTDLIGPLPRSTAGNTYLSVTTDYFTKYVFLKPLREPTSHNIIKHLKNDVILIYGAPKVAITDNAKYYRGAKFTEMCSSFKIDLKHNIAYNSRSNPTERSNQSIETMICSYIADDHRKWDLLMPELQWAMRSSLSAATKHTPHYLVFGKELSLDGRHHPLTALPDDAVELPEAADRDEYADYLKHLDDFRDEVQERLQEAQARNARTYNLRRREAPFKTGDRVWRKNFVKSNKAKKIAKKLAPKWVGPFVIKNKVGRVSYLLEDSNGVEDGPWHADQLKKHFPR